jgi:endonuclease-8
LPEGDTIFRAARTLHHALAGRVVTRFESVLPAVTRVDVDRPLAGRTIERVFARGKYLLIEFSSDLVLLTHMRMNGSWHIYRPGERWQRRRDDMRIAIETDAYVAVAFNVPVAEFHTSKSLARARQRTIGPDLLDASFDRDDAIANLRARGDLTIEDALLDQHALAGIGNVYKSEVLFLTGVHPLRVVRDLPIETLGTIVDRARDVMTANVRAGARAAIVTHRSLRSSLGSGREQHHWVYGRRGRPCRRCGTPIEMRKTGRHARTTFWCPKCQC